MALIILGAASYGSSCAPKGRAEKLAEQYADILKNQTPAFRQALIRKRDEERKQYRQQETNRNRAQFLHRARCAEVLLAGLRDVERELLQKIEQINLLRRTQASGSDVSSALSLFAQSPIPPELSEAVTAYLDSRTPPLCDATGVLEAKLEEPILAGNEDPAEVYFRVKPASIAAEISVKAGSVLGVARPTLRRRLSPGSYVFRAVGRTSDGECLVAEQVGTLARGAILALEFQLAKFEPVVPVTITPPNSRVSFNGQVLTHPVEVLAGPKCGSYPLTVTKEGYFPYRAEVQIDPSAPMERLEVDLRPRPGIVRLNLSPQRAVIRDLGSGEILRPLPRTRDLQLASGKHRLEVSRGKCFAAEEVLLDVPPGSFQELHLSLSEKVGEISVRTDPRGKSADLTVYRKENGRWKKVDAMSKQRLPAHFRGLPCGRYRVKAERRGHATLVATEIRQRALKARVRIPVKDSYSSW